MKRCHLQLSVHISTTEQASLSEIYSALTLLSLAVNPSYVQTIKFSPASKLHHLTQSPETPSKVTRCRCRIIYGGLIIIMTIFE